MAKKLSPGTGFSLLPSRRSCERHRYRLAAEGVLRVTQPGANCPAHGHKAVNDLINGCKTDSACPARKLQ